MSNAEGGGRWQLPTPASVVAAIPEFLLAGYAAWAVARLVAGGELLDVTFALFLPAAEVVGLARQRIDWSESRRARADHGSG